jgi:hypothetical protein
MVQALVVLGTDIIADTIEQFLCVSIGESINREIERRERGFEGRQMMLANVPTLKV